MTRRPMPDYVRAALAQARIALDNARKTKDRPRKANQ